MFDPKYIADVLLPLANAAYRIPLKVGTIPAEFNFVGRIEVDSSRISWEISRIHSSRRDVVRNLLQQNKFGWVCYSKNTETIVVAYKGTDCIYDILRDFEFDSEPYACVPNYGMVHVGFQHIYSAIRESVIELIKGLPQAKRCIVTGHSLGGALSQLSAPDLYYQHLLAEAPAIVNFASPRAGHQDFVDKLSADIKDYTRVVNKWDVIPMTPPMCNGYQHAGEVLQIDGGMTLIAHIAHGLETGYIPGLKYYLEKLAGE